MDKKSGDGLEIWETYNHQTSKWEPKEENNKISERETRKREGEPTKVDMYKQISIYIYK